MAKFTVSMKICSVSQESPPGRASRERAVGRATPGESPKIPDTALFRRSDGRICPEPQGWDGPAVTEAARAGGCHRLAPEPGTACRRRWQGLGRALRGLWRQSSSFCGGERRGSVISHCFLVASCVFYPFPSRSWETCSLSQAFL